MTQKLEQLLKTIFSVSVFLSLIPIKMKNLTPQLHLIYLDPQPKTRVALLTLEYLHMDGAQMW